MLNKIRTHISLVILCGLLAYVGAGCKLGLQLDELPLPKDLVQDARVAYYKGDRSGVIGDYARVDTGVTTPDGFLANTPTDADGIMNAATGDKFHLFIRMPNDEGRRDHILRSIAAASIREDFKKGDRWNIKVINTKLIKSDIASFGFDDRVAKDYFLSLAKKINQVSVANDIYVVDIDDFVFGLSADEFLVELSAPRIVVLSRKSIDSVKVFSDEKTSREYVPKGLNPGQIYQLAQLHLQRSKNVTDKAEQDKLALVIAKHVTAVEPHSNLGSVERLFSRADPLLNAVTKPANLDKEIIKGVALTYKANYDYLSKLRLDALTLQQINDQVKQNMLAYNEQARKTDEILRGMKGILGANLGDLSTQLGTKIDAGFRKSRAHLIDAVSENGDVIKQALAQETGDVKDLVVQTAKRIIGEQKGALEGLGDDINQHTNQAIKRTERLLADVMTQAEEEIKKRVSDESQITREEDRASTKQATRVSEDTLSRLNQLIVDVQKRLLTRLTGTVNDAQDTLSRDLLDVKAVTKDQIASAIRRIVYESQSATRDVAKDITMNVAGTVKRGNDVIAEHIAESYADASKRISEEGAATRGEVIAKTKRGIAQMQHDLSKKISQEAEDTKHRLMRHGEGVASETQKMVSDEIAKIGDEIIRRSREKLKEAIKKIARITVGQNKSLQGAVESAVKREHKITNEQIGAIKEETKKIVEDEVGTLFAEVMKLPGKNRRNFVEVARQLGRYEYELVNELVQFLSGNLEVRGWIINNTIGPVAGFVPGMPAVTRDLRVNALNESPDPDISINLLKRPMNRERNAIEVFEELFHSFLDDMTDRIEKWEVDDR